MPVDQIKLKLFSEYDKQLLADRSKSYEAFDKAILTLSGGGLALSLTFINNIIPLATAKNIGVLIVSWVLFALSILITLTSFVSSQFALEKQRKLAEDYYLKNDEAAPTRPNIWNRTTRILNLISGLFFIVAVVLLLYFVNLNLKGVIMSENKPLNEGTTAVDMTIVPTLAPNKGITAATIVPVPAQSQGEIGNNSTSGSSGNDTTDSKK